MECPVCGTSIFEWIAGMIVCAYCGKLIKDTNPVREKLNDNNGRCPRGENRV